MTHPTRAPLPLTGGTYVEHPDGRLERVPDRLPNRVRAISPEPVDAEPAETPITPKTSASRRGRTKE